MPLYEQQDFSIYMGRRKQLLQQVQSKNPSVKSGGILLLGAFEEERARFRQESTFYYFTGIEEPGAALFIDLDGQSTIFIPDYKGGRKQWVASCIDMNQTTASRIGFDKIELLGKPCAGYACYTFFSEPEYEYLVKRLMHVVRNDGIIFTCSPVERNQYVQQKIMLRDINRFMRNADEKSPQDFMSACTDISPVITGMRRKKTQHELELMYKAVGITCVAHEAVAQLLKPGKIEYELQAGLEYVFTESGASVAFPSIVGSGKNSTVLHYMLNNRVVEDGDVVVVDIGADYNYYCADLTRTYPVSGTFTDRQKEIYQLVLDAQEYIASIAKPGMYLSNKDQPEKSLNHLVRKFLDERGDYAEYMPHGIGHYLGIDLHDVGSLAEPLQEGDIFTIEPGVYLPKENIGVRIEDDYWMTTDGALCLSEELPKSIKEVERMVQQEMA